MRAVTQVLRLLRLFVEQPTSHTSPCFHSHRRLVAHLSYLEKCFRMHQSFHRQMSTKLRGSPSEWLPGLENPGGCRWYSQLTQALSNQRTRQNGCIEDDQNGCIEDDQKDAEEQASQGHTPVLVRETLAALSPKENQVIVDMTFGAGGHAKNIVRSAQDLTYVASDRDPVAYRKAVEFSRSFRPGQVRPLLSRFSELAVELPRIGIKQGSVDAFFMDLGASSMQFDTPRRGFSLSRDGPLDMRMDGERFPDSPTAADVVNSLDASDLVQILKKYGDESHALTISHAIVEARYAFGNFTRTSQLSDVVKTVFDSSFRHDKLHRHAHVATKTFQALRIFINDELNEIHNGLQVAQRFLKAGGRCVAISFHSLEDRIVKRHFHDIHLDERPNAPARHHLRNASASLQVEEVKQTLMSGPWRPVSRKVIEASHEEVVENPRSRSAKLRAAIKAG